MVLAAGLATLLKSHNSCFIQAHNKQREFGIHSFVDQLLSLHLDCCVRTLKKTGWADLL